MIIFPKSAIAVVIGIKKLSGSSFLLYKYNPPKKATKKSILIKNIMSIIIMKNILKLMNKDA